MRRIIAAAEQVFSGDTTKAIARQLFIEGFSFARECVHIELIPSTAPEYMYEVLLLHAPYYLDASVDGIEWATSRSEYAYLLRKSKKWVSSAEQLLLGCEAASKSPNQSSRLLADLRREVVALHPYLPWGSEETPGFADKAEKMLNHMEVQLDVETRARNVSKGLKASFVEDFLLPSDLPRDPTPEPSL